jgi:FAD/FMN-containing dehydrogenase
MMVGALLAQPRTRVILRSRFLLLPTHRHTPRLTDMLRRINALVDFSDPKEMIKHLLVGSEGTLGFVSRVTYNTVPDYKDKASAFVVFETVEDAAHATHLLREAKCTDAVELMDR